MLKKSLIVVIFFTITCFISTAVEVKPNSKENYVQTFSEFRNIVDKEILPNYKKE